jgi:hypothetical protein
MALVLHTAAKVGSYDTTRDLVEAGFVIHTGGRCPLPYSARVELAWSDGTIDLKPSFAGFWDRRWLPHHRPAGQHIVAYRLVQEK